MNACNFRDGFRAKLVKVSFSRSACPPDATVTTTCLDSAIPIRMPNRPPPLNFSFSLPGTRLPLKSLQELHYPAPMKLISWNVNGLRAVLRKNFLDYLTCENPDILCLQETKCRPEDVEQLWPTS